MTTMTTMTTMTINIAISIKVPTDASSGGHDFSELEME
jgi:hypothetical protein